MYMDLYAIKRLSTGKVSGGTEVVHRAPWGRWSKQASGKDPTVIRPRAHECSHSLGLPSVLLPLLTRKQAWELTGRKVLYTARCSSLWLGEGLDSSLEMHRCCLALFLRSSAGVSVLHHPQSGDTGPSSFFGVICYGCSYACPYN